MAHNERHSTLTCPSGHTVTNPLLKSNSRFQVTFVTNSSSISTGSRIGLGRLDWDTLTGAGQLFIQARTSVLAPRTQSNLRFVIRISGLSANFQKGIHNGQAGVNNTTFHTYASTALCKTPPLGSWGSLLDTLGNSRLLVSVFLGPYLPNQVSY